MWNAGVDAVVTIGAPEVIGCLVTEPRRHGETIVVATWSELAGVTVGVAAPDTAGDRRVVRLADGETVATTTEATMWTELDWSQAELARGRMFFAHDRPLAVDLLSVLGAIAAQLTLALERVELAHVVQETRHERRFQSIVQHSSDLITLLGPDLRTIYESPAVATALGGSPDGLIGHLEGELVHPDDEATARAQLTQGTHGRTRHHRDIRMPGAPRRRGVAHRRFRDDQSAR